MKRGGIVVEEFERNNAKKTINLENKRPTSERCNW
jgi:hypothetical protein